MKIKRLFSGIGLGLFAIASAAAGFVGAKAKKAEPVKADDPDTWMIHFSLDSKEIAGYMDADSMWVQTYTDGVGNSKWFQMYPIKSGSEYFAVNATFPESYSFNRVQYKFSQGGVEKWGVPYSLSFSKSSYARMVYSSFWAWSGDDWGFTLNYYSDIYAEYDGVSTTLAEDVANKRFVGTGLVSDESDYYTLYYRCSWDFVGPTLTDTAKSNFTTVEAEWCSMKAGTYDVILKNNNDDNGIIEVKKYETEVDTYIYYITETAEATPNNIYAYGGCEQFGAWPGTAITSVTGVVDVFSGGVIHFEGVNQKIYKIPVTTGYPDGDSGIIFNYNGDESKTKNNIIVGGAGYYFSTDVENNYVTPAGRAIEFILDAEEIRNAVTASGDTKQYSVCGISEGDAKDICDAFNALDNTARQYVVRTKALTYKRDGSDGNEMVAYEDILIELSKKCGVDVGLSSGINSFYFITDGSTSALIPIICAVAFVSMSSIGILLILKKRKHE